MTVSLEIEKSVYGGDGLGRLGDGRVAFVAGAFPGETVKAEIIEEKKRFVRCALREIVKPSPDRIIPSEELAEVPGMTYACVTPAAELRYKQDQLENFLWKLEHKIVPLEVIDSPSYDHYRNKVVYHAEFRKGEWRIGYRTEPSHEVTNVLRDPLAVPEINAVIADVRRTVLSLLVNGASNVRREIAAKAAENVTIRWSSIDGVKWWYGDAPAALSIREKTYGKVFQVPADGFYQVNPQVHEQLVKAVVDSYRSTAAEMPYILDLYCGVGVFGLACLAGWNPPQGVEPRLVGVESGKRAIVSAKANAASLGVKANFFCERVGGSVHRLKAGPRHVVIVDPPRGGLEINVARWLASSRAGRILYVSCDPATLVRDLTEIMKGGYTISRTRLFNMFPRTARFETFVELERIEIAK